MKHFPYTVAIVDDSEFMRENARFRLTALGYNVVMEAADGQQFLHQLSKGAVPDICLLDINMPVMDGFETARYLKKDWPAVRILFHSMEKISEYSYTHAGVDGFIAKDASSRDFSNALLNIMGINQEEAVR